MRAEEAGDKLTAEELQANIGLLFGAGHETTTNLIGNGLLALHRQPDQWERLKADPSLIPNAVEELLRYDSSVQMTGRVTNDRGRDRRRHAGARTKASLTLLGAANRDPAQYPDPDRLDVGRQNVRPMSFGGGIHHCLGAQLARLEAELVFTALIERLPNLELAGEGHAGMAAELHLARAEQAAGGVALDRGVGRWRDAGGARAANIRAPARTRKTVGRCSTLGDGSLLAVVADGMGGHAGGAVASKLAVEAFVHAVEQGGGLADGAAGGQRRGRQGPRAAKPELAGMGATLVAAQVRGDEVRWISVGDSPLFLVSAGRLERLNADHSMAPQIDALVERAAC